MWKIGFALAALALFGCAPQPSPEQLAQAQLEQQLAQQAQLHANAATCENDYKARPGTSAFTQCMIALGQQQQQAQQQRLATAIALMGAMKMPAPYQLPMPAPTAPSAPVSCTSLPIGTTVYTNCY